MNKSESIDKIAPALVAAQRGMGNAVKDSKNPFFKSKYADLNSVREVAHPALNANDITVLQPTVHIDGRNFVETLLLHSSGQFISGLTEIICAKQNDPQAYGSAISYTRRYGLQSLMSIGAEDSDAEGAMNRNVASEAKPTVTAAVSNGSFKKPQAAKSATPGLDEGWS